MAQFDGYAGRGDGTDQRKAKLKVRREPFVLDRIARAPEFLEDLLPVELDKMRQHETIMQRISPIDQLAPVRLFPKPRDQRPHQKLLREAHSHGAASRRRAIRPGRAAMRQSRPDTTCRCKS